MTTSQRELDSLLSGFFAEGPDVVADRVIDDALEQIDLTRQRRPMRVPWRFQSMNMLSRVAAAAVIGVLLVGTFFYLTRPAVAPIGPSPSPDVTAGPTAGPSAPAVPSLPAVVPPSPTSPTAVITTAPNPTFASASGTSIAFVRLTDKADNTNCPGYDPPPNCPTWRLWIVGTDGTGAHELFPGGFGEQRLDGWSPDGTRLLYSDDGKFFMTDVTGSEPQFVDTGCVEPCRYDDSFSFSNDGAHLVFVRTRMDADGYDGPPGIATMDLSSGLVTELSSTTQVGSPPGWSPDGTKIIFSTYGDKDMGITGPIPPKVAGVFVVDVDGQNLHLISPPDLDSESAAWSPDGSRIVFLSTSADGHDIYTISPDGTDLQRLSSDGASTGAAWTPDGRILFVRSASDGLSSFWTMNADGTNAVELVPGAVTGATTYGYGWEGPLWQPTGGAAIVPLPWNATAGTPVGPPPPTPVATPTPSLAPGFSWTGSVPATTDNNTNDTATLLTDGRVLVTRGCDPSGRTGGNAVELYDPTTGTFTPAGSMTTPRFGETVTRLLDGRVLITGGYNCGTASPSDTTGIWASAELYDPTTGTFSPTGSMGTPREFHTATLLLDGRVLITGGQTGNVPPVAFQVVFASYESGSTTDGRLAASAASVLATAELYDPTTGTFSPTGSMKDFRDRHAATLLQDGRVLVLGGGGEGYAARTSAELYDPTTGTFSQTGPMQHARWLFTATLLNDGNVLIAGGRSAHDSSIASAEVYDPGSGTFSSAGSMGDSRQGHTATLLQDGRVLITGGYQQDAQHWDVLSATEMYDPATGAFTPVGSMGDARDGHVAALLNDGRVLIAGGSGIGIDGIVAMTSAVLYQP